MNVPEVILAYLKEIKIGRENFMNDMNEKETYRQQVLEYSLLLRQRNKNLTDEEAVNIARRTICNLNISFVLADVLNSFFIDCQADLSRMSLTVSGEDKHRFLLMMKAIQSARHLSSAFARPLYLIDDADDACKASDWYYNFLKLVEEKITDARKSHMLIEYLLNMPSEHPLYNVKYEDFKV